MHDSPHVFDNAEPSAKPRKFRLWLYLLIIFALSWPFLLPSALISFDNYWIPLIWSSIGMLMVTVGTFIAGCWIFQDGFSTIGWRWGNASSWMLALGLPLIIFILPAVVDMLVGTRTLAPLTWKNTTLTLYVVFFTPILGFGEEFGFRGYLLPRIWWMGARKALIVGAIIYWAWHWPVWLIPFVSTSMTNAGQLNLNMVIQMLPTILFGALLTGCTAIILSYVWMRSGSIVVSSVFHGYFDGLRNITMFYLLVNASALSNIYYVAFIIILTLLLLWRGRWVLPEPLELRVLKVNNK